MFSTLSRAPADVEQRTVSRRLTGSILPKRGEDVEMKNRIRQRENRRKKAMEERLDKRNACGVKDLTAYNAVQQIRTSGKATIVLQ